MILSSTGLLQSMVKVRALAFFAAALGFLPIVTAMTTNGTSLSTTLKRKRTELASSSCLVRFAMLAEGLGEL